MPLGCAPATSVTAAAPTDYERHRPEETILYATLQAQWKTFLADLQASAESPLPAFVTSEVEAFLRCGILAHGFVLARCGDCGWCRAVAFSCQRRGFCPSCIGRRMADFAARLVDRVVPAVPLRQWVLTVPHALRARFVGLGMHAMIGLMFGPVVWFALLMAGLLFGSYAPARWLLHLFRARAAA